MKMTTQKKGQGRRWESDSINSVDERMLDEEDDSMIGQYSPTTALLEDTSEWPIPQQKFLRMFPDKLDRFFTKFDDVVIYYCQKVSQGRIIQFIDLAITGVVAIETGIAAPFFFFILGMDGFATALSYLMLVLCLFSQIPKRFLWRPRPYMARRANKLRKAETATTSSFPSRAVTCATVYSFLASYAYMHIRNETVQWWMPILVVCTILLSSFARINMGVHYPSDCLIGFLQGVLVSIFGTLLWKADSVLCDSCFRDDCYTEMGSSYVINGKDLGRINWVIFSIATLLSLTVTVVSTLKPIDFWGKCDRVYGMLLPGIVFQLTFLCPRTAGTSLPPPDTIPWFAYFYSVGFLGLATGVGFWNNGRYPVLSYLFLFVLLSAALFYWRLWVI